MSLLAWIVLGLIAGFVGSKIVNNTGQGLIVDILLGVVGAVVGGFLFNQFGQPGVSGLNLYSLLVAIVGGCRRAVALPHPHTAVAGSTDPPAPIASANPGLERPIRKSKHHGVDYLTAPDLRSTVTSRTRASSRRPRTCAR